MRHNEVASVWSGIRRTYGVVQVGKSALLTDDIRHMIEGLPDTLRGLRDASLLLVGFASAMRRSELASLLVSDLEFCEEGLKLHIRRSKTDQEGKGAIVGICFGANPQTCPIRATKRWLTAAGIESGFVWRAVLKGGRLQKSRMAGDSIGLLVKRAAASIGLDTAKFAGHSLRAGFVTQASRAGVSESSIMRTTRHRSIAMVQRYCREVDVWRNNAGAKLGL
jgi:integrase